MTTPTAHPAVCPWCRQGIHDTCQHCACWCHDIPTDLRRRMFA